MERLFLVEKMKKRNMNNPPNCIFILLFMLSIDYGALLAVQLSPITQNQFDNAKRIIAVREKRMGKSTT